MSQPWQVNHNPTLESDSSSLSPRTELLSPEPLDEAHLNPPIRTSRGPGVKFRRERERVHSNVSSRDLLRLLINEEYESKQTRKVLYTAFDRLEQESKRADAAEARIEETLRQTRAINEARITAERSAARTQQELNLYKLRLDTAQNEINRAGDVLKAIEAQRDEAENAALEARSKARRLNEERLIELAREEGRRLGFEEGVRRGRRMVISYRDGYEDGRLEMREVATEAVDRLLEAREEEQEEIEVLEAATPVPPPFSSRSAPDVHRLETPVNSSMESQRHSSRSTRDSTDSRSTLRHAPEQVIPPPGAVESRIVPPPPVNAAPPPSQSSRHQPKPQPQPQSQPWPIPPVTPVESSFSRPVSIRNSPPSVRHGEIHVPPDGYIPTADENLNINIPPPHEFHRNIPSPTPEQQPTARPERRRSRDYMYENAPPPRRPSPDESLSSTKQSASSTLSQLDLVGLPSGRRRGPQGLSVIHEDPSVRSGATTPHSQTVASTSHSPHPHRGMGRESSETLHQERKAKQQLADELRYSDPTQPEQWRRYAENSRSQSSLSGPPPNHRPVIPTIPTPLSPPRVLQDPRYRRIYSERQGRPDSRSDHIDQRRPLSSDSSVPEISVEPPSGPPSDAPSRGHGEIPPNGFLSPDHANRPLPIPAPAPREPAERPFTPSLPNSPGNPHANLASEIYNVPNSRQHSPGFFPSASANGSSQGPVIPQNTGGSSSAQIPRYSVPYGASTTSERERDSSSRSKTPISFYAQSPVPAGVTYPAPPISRSATYSAPSYAGSAPSEGRRRRDSMSASAGMTPAMRARPIQSAGSTTEGTTGSNTRDARVSKRPSNASLGSSQQGKPSYSRYNPSVYNDPAYLASNDSLVDSVTNANTAANGGRTRGGKESGHGYE